MLTEIPNCAVLTAINFVRLENSHGLKVGEKRDNIEIVGREYPHFKRYRLPLKDAFVVCLDTETEKQEAGLSADRDKALVCEEPRVN